MISIKKYLRKLAYKIFATKAKDIYQIIDHYDYISFDIFDTLIKRNTSVPSDIFEIVEQAFNGNINGFKEKRIKAEKIARKTSQKEEITIYDIYRELDYKDSLKKEIINKECEIEKKYCTVNKNMYEVYKYCLKNNKKIFITSDMYLPKKIIKEILEDNGYNKYDELYLSNEFDLTKHSGNLFKKILDISSISPYNIVHIGDSITSDYLRPRKFKMKGILINKKENHCIFNSRCKKFDYSVLYNFINNNMDKDYDDYSKFGYEVLGPLLYSFTTYINQKAKKDEIEKVYFLARDAKLIMDAYQNRFQTVTPNYYLHISRKAVTFANLVDLVDFDDLYSRSKGLLFEYSTVQDLIKIFKLDIICPFQNKMLKNLTNEEKTQIFTLLKNELDAFGNKQNMYLYQYLMQKNFSGKVALIDVGWSGTIQYYLQKYIDKNGQLFGYYYGVEPSKVNKEDRPLNRKGLLYDGYSKDLECQAIIGLSRSFFELMFLSTESSTICYQEEDNVVIPVYDKKDQSKLNESLIKEMQKSAIEFVKDAEQSKIKDVLDDFSKDTFFENYKNLIIHPEHKIIKMFENLEVRDIDKSKLFEHKSMVFYIFHPHQFYNDFSKSSCKIFFLKSVFKITLPYYKILKKLYIIKKDK